MLEIYQDFSSETCAEWHMSSHKRGNDSLTLSAAVTGHLMGCEEKEQQLFCIILIPLSFPFGFKEHWTHLSVVCLKPLLSEEKRELSFVLTGSHRKCALTEMNLCAPPLTGQMWPRYVMSCAPLPQ